MTPAPNILLADDDDGVRVPLCTYLSRFGFVMHATADGAGLRHLLGTQCIDLLVLGLGLPGADGLPGVRALRAVSRIPLIALAACSSPGGRAPALEMGADDCMSKPFEPRELVARIHTVLRRVDVAARANTDLVRFDGWALQHSERRLTSPAGQVLPLSNAEYLLLATFLKTPRRVLSRDQLMAQARGRAMDAFDRSIDLLVSRLRQKLLGESGTAILIKTVRGAGYLFDAQSVEGQAAWGR
jgi:two-component system OmpR family response regulator